MSTHLFAIIWTDANKQILGAILGGAIGAVIGATSTFFISEHTRRKQIELNEIDKLRVKINLGLGALSKAQNDLHNLLVMCVKNKAHSTDLKKGIYDSSTKKTIFTLNLPQPFSINKQITEDLINVELSIYWSHLVSECSLHNRNIQEFNDFYQLTRTSVHKSQLHKPNNLNEKTLESNSDTIINSSIDQLEEWENYKQKCIKAMALIELHSAKVKLIDYRTTNLVDLKKYYLSLVNHKTSEKKLSKTIDELTAKYADDKIFTVDKRIISSDT